jgi:serine/threonine protein kinase
VAVKIFKKQGLTYKQIEWIRTEIEVLTVCNHPNIVRLYEVFESTDTIYMVIELLSDTLYNYMNKKAFIIEETIVRKFMISITRAVSHLHIYGIIHRDIKADNVMLNTSKNDVKIVDLGLAKILEPNELAIESVGTLCYAAPEIIEGAKYTEAVDMWSLGVLCYSLLNGELPFPPGEYEEMTAKYCFV